MDFKRWINELMEPNLLTAKDPINGPHVTNSDQNDDAELENIPMGMRSHKATNAFPELKYRRPRPFRMRN